MHISIVTSKILGREVNIVMVLPMQFAHRVQCTQQPGAISASGVRADHGSVCC